MLVEAFGDMVLCRITNAISGIRSRRDPFAARAGYRSRGDRSSAESAFLRLHLQTRQLERKLRTRTSELEAADRHIAKLEEKILKLREATRELKQLKKEKHALRKCPERKVGQVILAPYRLPQKLFREVRKQFARPGEPAPREDSRTNINLGSRAIALRPIKSRDARGIAQISSSTIDQHHHASLQSAGERFEGRVDSVLAQAYENWELILVDDASTRSETLEALPDFGRTRSAHPVSATGGEWRNFRRLKRRSRVGQRRMGRFPRSRRLARAGRAF